MKVCGTVGILSMCVAVGAMAGPENGPFRHTLSLGVTLTDGNSETLQAHASYLAEGEKEGLGSVRFGADANYGENTVDGQTDTTVENARLFGNARRTLSPRTFVSLDASLLYDEVADIDYRGIVAPGVGTYLVKTPRTTLSLEIGPAYVWEKVAGVTDDYAAVRMAERATRELSETARLWQSVEYIPKADDWADYILNAEIGVEAALNARMNLRLLLRNTYDSSPGEGLEKNDVALVAGVSLTL